MMERIRIAPPRRRAGYTFVELLMGTLVAAALVAVAAPPVLGLQRGARISEQVDALAGDLRYARAEAIARSRVVSLCASADGQRCGGGNGWRDGWLVFVDADADGRFAGAPAELLLRRHPAWTGRERFDVVPAVAAISYARSGFLQLPHVAPIRLTLRTWPPVVSATRCVSLDLTGRPVVQRGEACG